MVSIGLVRSSITTLVRSQPLVAVVAGGTTGIGEYTVRALVTTHAKQGKGLRLYIVGRNASAAAKTITDCLQICPNGFFKFVRAEDLALLRDVDRVCNEIARLEKEDGGLGRVDLLVMTQGMVSFEGRRETTEGLDRDMSLLYYSRMRFIVQLSPLLFASTLPSAHILSVYAAGKEGKLFQDDLSLRGSGNYSFANCRSHVTYMKTLFMESLAKRHPGRLSLVHVFPSVVITPAYNNPSMPWWFKVAWALLGPVAKVFSTKPEECGERILFLATERFPARALEGGEKGATTDIAKGSDGVLGSGAYAVDLKGEPIDVEKAYVGLREGGFAEKVWEHTMKAFGEIEAGRKFAE